MTDDSKQDPLPLFDELVKKHKEEGKRLEDAQNLGLPPAVKNRTLGRELYPSLDLFVSDMWVPKSDVASLEHPVFSLHTRRSLGAGYERRTYEHRGNFLEITSPTGIANIFDRDILLVCISHIVKVMNSGEEPSKTVLVKPYAIMQATNRGTSGKEYVRLRQGLERLQQTSITTNIKTGNRRVYKGFNLIDSWEVHEGKDEDGKCLSNATGALKITVSDWLFNAIVAREVINLPRKYFRISSPLIRRLYELFLKHLGNQSSWTVNLLTLYNKTGYSSHVSVFRRNLKKITEENGIPDFNVRWKKSKSDDDQLVITRSESDD